VSSFQRTSFTLKLHPRLIFRVIVGEGVQRMELTATELPDGIWKFDLSGRLDVEGASDIDLKLTIAIAGQPTLAIIDLTDVDFLASLGIGTLVRTAKAARLRGGNMVLFNPQPNVAKVLASTRIDHVIPICYELAQALTLVRMPPPTPL